MASKSGELVDGAVTKSRTITLKRPLKRGEKEVTEISLVAPDNGAMRGLRIFAVMEGDVQQLSILLPRITNPPISETEFQNMPFSDQAELAGNVLYFLD